MTSLWGLPVENARLPELEKNIRDEFEGKKSCVNRHHNFQMLLVAVLGLPEKFWKPDSKNLKYAFELCF